LLIAIPDAFSASGYSVRYIRADLMDLFRQNRLNTLQTKGETPEISKNME
jgi:hypothetical protein